MKRMSQFFGVMCVGALLAVSGCKKEESKPADKKTETKAGETKPGDTKPADPNAPGGPAPTTPPPGGTAQPATPPPGGGTEPATPPAGGAAQPTTPPADPGAAPGAPADKEMPADMKKQALADMEAFVKEVCSCKDQACFEGVLTKNMEKFKKYEGYKEPPEAQEMQKKIMECVGKFQQGGAP
jgi:hypothetical protein